MSKHIKLRPKLEYEPQRFPPDRYGYDIGWWVGVDPIGAMNFYRRAELADRLTKNKQLALTLHIVTRSSTSVYLRTYKVGIRLAHILVDTERVIFENYWLAHGFKLRLEAKLREQVSR